MKIVSVAILVLAASPALAHPGHVGWLEGHAHVLAAAAAVAALAIAVFWAGDRLARRMRRRRTS